MTILGFCKRQMKALAAFLICMCISLPSFAEVREVWWDDLIPPGVSDFDINGMLMDASTFSGISYDPLFFPVNPALDNQQIRIPGYVVPITFELAADGEAFWGTAAKIYEFMLVPYVGACIHVPPPPPNQIVYVTSEEPFVLTELFVPVWVTGEMLAKSKSSAIAETGYTLEAANIELFTLPHS